MYMPKCMEIAELISIFWGVVINLNRNLHYEVISRVSRHVFTRNYLLDIIFWLDLLTKLWFCPSCLCFVTLAAGQHWHNFTGLCLLLCSAAVITLCASLRVAKFQFIPTKIKFWRKIPISNTLILMLIYTHK